MSATTNIVTAFFDEKNVVRTRRLTQYDYGQILQFEGIDLPYSYQVYFSNSYDDEGEAKMQLGTADGVPIPDEYLQTGETIYAYVFLHNTENDGETRYTAIIPVSKRPVGIPEEPTPVQQDVITEAIAMLNTAMEVSVESANSAESYAVGGTGTRPGEDTDNAKFYAEVAQQGAEHSGYAYFDIDNNDGCMYVTVADNLDTEVEFQINENTGELEVNVK